MRARLEVLSRDEIEAVQGATLEVLGRVGVRVREPRAVDLLVRAGARAVNGRDALLLPEPLIREALSGTPKAWTWHAREPRHSLGVGEGGRTRFGPGSACTKVVDYGSSVARSPTDEDGDRFVRLMDALELVDINYTPVTPSGHEDLPRYRETSTLVRDLENTTKVLVGPSFDGTMAKDGLQVAAILAGGKDELRGHPMLAGYCDPVSPLVHDRTMTETLIEYAAQGQPVFITCLDLAGASSPAGLAATLVQQNAEVLSGLVIAYLVNPHAPVVYGCVSGSMDMRTGTAALGGPEFGLLSAASVQIAHSYGLPCTAGSQSDALAPDAQTSFEKATTLMASVLAGADFVDLFFGSFEGYNATSLEQVVIDEEIAGHVLRYAEGIGAGSLKDDLELIAEVGPGGNYLRSGRALRDSMARMKKESYFPSLLDRRLGGSPAARPPALLDLAHARVTKILKEHTPAPLDPTLRKEMDAVLERIRQEESSKS